MLLEMEVQPQQKILNDVDSFEMPYNYGPISVTDTRVHITTHIPLTTYRITNTNTLFKKWSDFDWNPENPLAFEIQSMIEKL